MPIKPENKARYPKDWKQISKRIRERAGDKCEFCGVANGEIGARDKSGEWYDEKSIDNLNSGIGEVLFGGYPKMTKIVLTVAHLDHTPENVGDDNLKALCQRCHLRYDAEHHKKNRRETYENKKGLLGFNFNDK